MKVKKSVVKRAVRNKLSELGAYNLGIDITDIIFEVIEKLNPDDIVEIQEELDFEINAYISKNITDKIIEELSNIEE